MNLFKNILRKDPATPAADATKPGAATRNAKPKAPPAPPQRPAADAPPADWVAAILRCPDKSLALEWTAAVSGDSSLGEIAARSRFGEVRMAAALRLDDAEVLERVADACRSKDKGVFRHCQDLLRQRNTAGDTARRAQVLAEALRELLAATPVQLSRLLELEHALLSLPGAAEDPTVEACKPQLAEAHARLQQEAIARRDLTQAQAQAAALQATMFDAGWPDDDTRAGWQTQLATLAAVCSNAPAWLATQPATHKLGETLAVLNARLATLSADAERLAAAQNLLDALPADTPPDEAARAAWAALELPAHAQARALVDARWQALQPQPVAAAVRAPAASAGPAPDREAQRQNLDALEAAIAAGHLGEADALDKLFADAALPEALDQRLQHARAQLAQLHGWARWGTDQARDHLVTAAETLQAANLPVDELARQVPALREAWKQLNAQGHSRKGQWEKFDAALTAAFAPVLALRAEEAAQHAVVKAAKEALLDEWEAFVASPVWGEADQTTREQWRHNVLERWRAAGMAAFRDERRMRKRFDALVADVDRQLERARSAERERRRGIVAAAEALAEVTDLRRAIADAKSLQQAWPTPPGAARLPRKEEQQLWQQFRAACDRVFARRDDERSRHNAERDALAKSHQQALDAFDAALAVAMQSGDANAVRQATQAFRAQVGRTPQGGADARTRELEQRARALADELTVARHRAEYDLLARKAAIAERVEAATLERGETASADAAATPDGESGTGDLIAQAQQEWGTLPRLPAKAEAALAARLAAAADASADALAAGRTARASLVLDLEIALDLPSPPACTEERRARQLSRLQRRFGTAAESPAADAGERIAQYYATAATPDAALDARIVAVVQHLVRATLAAAAAKAEADKARLARAERSDRGDRGERGGRPGGDRGGPRRGGPPSGERGPRPH